MKYRAEIIIKENSSLFNALKPEMYEDKRSATSIKKTNNKITIIISAKDSVAFQAHLNGIVKLIRVYEKTKEVG